jgi:hypothetical protein
LRIIGKSEREKQEATEETEKALKKAATPDLRRLAQPHFSRALQKVTKGTKTFSFLPLCY